MLLEFTVGNYRSFEKDATLSMVATSLRSRDRALDEGASTPLGGDVRALHAAAIYGANASGKSNLVKALDFFLDFVRDSAREGQAGDRIDVVPFLLSETTREEPSSFEIVFLLDGVQYRYGFEVDRERVHAEWLYRRLKREAVVFVRQDGEFQLGSAFSEAKALVDRTRSNALLLSVAAQFSVPLATSVLTWFARAGVTSGLADGTIAFTAECIREQRFDGRVMALIRALDVGFGQVAVEEKRVGRDTLPPGMPDELVRVLSGQRILTVTAEHLVYDANGDASGVEHFDLGTFESEGTRKLFALAGPLVDTLASGGVMVIDEFDARLHPLASRELVRLFQRRETNPHGAQLIVATHDTNLLSRELFRRDQIWFTEKDAGQATVLYPLLDFSPRRKEALEKGYLAGRYGAVPFFADHTDGE